MTRTLTLGQRKALRRLRKYSFDRPLVTNSSQEKITLLGLEELGLVETQWSEDFGAAVLFAWIRCRACIKGVRFARYIVDGLIPFQHCDECCRYDHALAAADDLGQVVPIEVLGVDQDRSFGFGLQIDGFDSVRHFLNYHWSIRVQDSICEPGEILHLDELELHQNW